eukprot:364561-Chlamydomonas_euryale.AAC.1
MAAAGEGLSRLEPWLPDSPARRPGVLPPVPAVPWLPPWNVPSDAVSAFAGQVGTGGGHAALSTHTALAAAQQLEAPAYCAATDGRPSSAVRSSLAQGLLRLRSGTDFASAGRPMKGRERDGDGGSGGGGGGSFATALADDVGAAAAPPPLAPCMPPREEEPADAESLPRLERWHAGVLEDMRECGWWLRQRAHAAGAEARGVGACGPGNGFRALRASLLPSRLAWAAQQPPVPPPGGAAARDASCVGDDGGNACALQAVLSSFGWLLEAGPPPAPRGATAAHAQAYRPRPLPPVDVLLSSSVVPLLQECVSAINTRLLGRLLSEWGLLAELAQLRNMFLLASPAMQGWASWLLSALLKGKVGVDVCVVGG